MTTEPDYNLIRAVIRRDTEHFIKLAANPDKPNNQPEIELIANINLKLADLLEIEGLLARAQVALCGSDKEAGNLLLLLQDERVVFALTDLFWRGFITGQSVMMGAGDAAN